MLKDLEVDRGSYVVIPCYSAAIKRIHVTEHSAATDLRAFQETGDVGSSRYHSHVMTR